LARDAEVGFLPLAIGVIGACIKVEGIMLAAYLTLEERIILLTHLISTPL
jgi:hypothetical protein